MAEFVSGLDVHLSREALEALRRCRDPDINYPHPHVTSIIAAELMRQGVWPDHD